MNWLFDNRTDCYSVLTTMRVSDYVTLIESAHSAKGGLAGQRDTLKTTTAKRIRHRMVQDIRMGAVLPPVVIGAVVPGNIFDKYSPEKTTKIETLFPEKSRTNFSIIDGMQRTAAIMEASEIDTTVLSRDMRVEFWITRSIRTMVYRMLVLNTGQVPWTLARQLSVVYAPLLDEVTSRVPEIGRVFTPDRPGRRVAPGEFSSDALVELYIAFSLRKTTIDTKEALSDEFSRLDFVENLSNSAFQDQFYESLRLLVMLDKSFSLFDPGKTTRFAKGRNVFDSQPARIGFIVSIAQHVLGRPGMDRPEAERSERLSEVAVQLVKLTDHISSMNQDELSDFLRLDVLAETLDRRVGQVGRYERSVFFDAFTVLVQENFDVPNMEPCWRAN